MYRFAKGEVIDHGAGYPIQISRPLDFAAADGRIVDSTTGALAPVGNTVDSSNATYQNAIGGSSVTTVDNAFG